MSSKRTSAPRGYARNSTIDRITGQIEDVEGDASDTQFRDVSMQFVSGARLKGQDADDARQAAALAALQRGEAIPVELLQPMSAKRSEAVSPKLEKATGALRLLGLPGLLSLSITSKDEHKQEVTWSQVHDTYLKLRAMYDDQIDVLYKLAADRISPTTWDEILGYRRTRSQRFTEVEGETLRQYMQPTELEQLAMQEQYRADAKTAYNYLKSLTKPKLSLASAVALSAVRHKLAVFIQSVLPQVRELNEAYDPSLKGYVPIADPSGFWHRERQPDESGRRHVPITLPEGVTPVARIGRFDDKPAPEKRPGYVYQVALAAQPPVPGKAQRSMPRSQQAAADTRKVETHGGETIEVVETAPGGFEQYLRLEVFGLAKDMLGNVQMPTLTSLARELHAVSHSSDASVSPRIVTDLEDVERGIKSAASNVQAVAVMHMMHVCRTCRMPAAAFASPYPPGEGNGLNSRPPTWSHLDAKGGVADRLDQDHPVVPATLIRDGDVMWDPEAGWPVTRSDFGLADLRAAVALLDQSHRLLAQLLLAFKPAAGYSDDFFARASEQGRPFPKNRLPPQPPDPPKYDAEARPFRYSSGYDAGTGRSYAHRIYQTPEQMAEYAKEVAAYKTAMARWTDEFGVPEYEYERSTMPAYMQIEAGKEAIRAPIVAERMAAASVLLQRREERQRALRETLRPEAERRLALREARAGGSESGAPLLLPQQTETARAIAEEAAEYEASERQREVEAYATARRPVYASELEEERQRQLAGRAAPRERLIVDREVAEEYRKRGFFVPNTSVDCECAHCFGVAYPGQRYCWECQTAGCEHRRSVECLRTHAYCSGYEVERENGRAVCMDCGKPA